jgi:hypothetical protein
MADSARQMEELREVVRSLERQLQRAGQLPARGAAAPATREAPTPGGRQATPQLDVAAFEEMFSDRRPPEDDRITALTGERDGLRRTLDERERELQALREDVANGQAALAAQAREIQALQIGMAETVHQAEEIQKVLRAVEQETETAARHQAVLEEALRAEQRQVRDIAARASQEQLALREDLDDAENLLAEARKDIAASQGLIASLQQTAEEERARNAALQDQLRAQAQVLTHFTARGQAANRLLDELANAVGGSDASGKDVEAGGRERNWLDTLVQAPATGAHPDREGLAILQQVVETLRRLLPPAEGALTPPLDLATDDAAVRQSAEEVVDRWRRLLRERAEAVAPPAPVREEPERAAEQVVTKPGERDVLTEGTPAVPELEARVVVAEEAPVVPQEPPTTPASPTGVRQVMSQRPGPRSGMTVECQLPDSGTGTACILRGEITRINDMGLLGVFEERLPEGLQMVVRFVRDGALVSRIGRVVRVQESAGASDARATLNHLIRFESPVSASDEEPQASAR